jgi:hypothetical protein
VRTAGRPGRCAGVDCGLLLVFRMNQTESRSLRSQ